MNIDTRTIVSNSNNFQKRVKDLQSSTRTDKILDANKVAQAEQQLDYASVTQTDNSFIKRVVENNTRLSAFENNFNKVEFLEQRLEMLEKLDVATDQAEINNIVANSVYEGSNVFDKYASDLSKVVDKLDEIKVAVSVEKASMNEELKGIEIANQNILSVNTVDNDVAKIADLGNLSKVLNLNNKRVIDLIS